MRRAAQVEIDHIGHVHPIDPTTTILEGNAVLTWPDDPAHLSLLLSESSFADDWLNAEEDATWPHFQPDNQ